MRKSNDTTIKNVFYLYILRGLQYIFPLITMPLLIQRLGVSNYGIITYSQAVTSYFIILVNYGFNLSAPREVAKNRENIKVLSSIFNRVFFVKSFILIICTPIIIIVGFSVPILRENIHIYLLLYISLINELIFPVWFFQGTENMKFITRINIFTRLIGVVLLYFFVHGHNDTWTALLLMNLSNLIGGLIGFVIVMKKYSIHFAIPKITEFKAELISGFDLFIAQGATTLFSNGNIFILGIILTPVQVGNYAIAEKIMRMIASFVAPISQSLYPISSKLFSESKERAMDYLRKYTVLGGVFFFLIFILTIVFSDFIIEIVAGNKANETIKNMLMLMAIIPLSIFINNIYGTQIMLNTNNEKLFRNIVVSVGGLLPILSFIFTNINSNYGGTVALLISEISLTLIMIIYIEFIKKEGFINSMLKRETTY